jgi:hypothetical protein
MSIMKVFIFLKDNNHYNIELELYSIERNFSENIEK